eukprot:1792358-Prymnesium_polylepis.1
MLVFAPAARIRTPDALRHAWFEEIFADGGAAEGGGAAEARGAAAESLAADAAETWAPYAFEEDVEEEMWPLSVDGLRRGVWNVACAFHPEADPLQRGALAPGA